MNNETQTREWLYALAASKLAKGDLRGVRPTLVEIEQWRLGTLQQLRADEVLSYVAHDERCFAQWRDLCEEQRWLDSERQGSHTEDQPLPNAAPEVVQRDSWLGGVAERLGVSGRPLWAGAAVAALFALLVVPMLIRPGGDAFSQAYLQQLDMAGGGLGSEFPAVLARATKSVQGLDNTVVNTDKRQFQLGLAAAAARVNSVQDERWDSWQKTLPETVYCSVADSGDCSSESLRNQALGSWSLVTALACGDTQVDSDFWRQQATALDTLAEGTFSQGHFLAARLQKPLPKARESLCMLANGLLGQGG